MSAVQEASDLIKFIGASRKGPINILIDHAARCLRWKRSRAQHVWYKNARRIDAQEIDQLRNIANRVAKERAVKAVVELRQSLASAGAGMDRQAADVLDHALRLLGEPVRAVDVPEETGE